MDGLKLPVIGPDGKPLVSPISTSDVDDLDMTDAELEDEIRRLKRERNAVILAHYYQESEIQDLADFVGDSLQLSQAAATTKADVICFCGVHFMAETAKILNPDKIVVVPDLAAGCSLADGCPAPVFEKWLQQYPGHTVVSYINCSAEVKALSDVICTSSNAVKIVKALGEDKVVFAPDKHLGAFVQKQTGRDDIVLWQGTCIVHETFSERKIVDLKVAHPEAEFIAHPECEPTVLRHADFIGSTSALLGYVSKSPKQSFIVGTETGILHQMKKAAPSKTLIAGPFEGEEKCACNQCPHMKLNTLEKLWLCLKTLKPTLEMSPDLIAKAKIPLERMLALG